MAEPKTAAEHYNVGCALQAEGNHAAAVPHYETALKLKPDFASAANNLGNAWVALGRRDAAARAFRQAVGAQPDHPNALASLGGILLEQGDVAGAVTLLERCIARNPKHLMALLHMASACHVLKRPSAAVAHYRSALAELPKHAALHNNLGSRLVDAGRPAEAIAAFAQALALDPSFAVAHSNLVLTRQYLPGLGAADHLADAKGWDARHGRPRASLLPPPPNTRDPERVLRLGYVSGDLRRHPVGFFMAGPLAHHDRARFDVVVYNAGSADAYTELLRHAHHTWRDIRTVGDRDAAQLIRADAIDILVDLAGHTSGNRLTLFAMKPAPVQITAGGHTGTTGCAAIDYLVSDRYETPEGAEQGFAEGLIRMPGGYVCYAPPETAPEVGPLPAARTGTITFGCFNNIAKLNNELASVWARVLAAVPNSRLLLRAGPLDEPATAQHVRRIFTDSGVPPERLALAGGADHTTFLGFYNDLDIALDPFPYSGGLTTLEALWMGVPVVTLAGATFAGRHSLSHLTNAGLGELVAHTRDEYVAIGQTLARSLERLADLRRGMRVRLRASPLLDASGYTQALEAAYREAWRDWCAQAHQPPR